MIPAAAQLRLDELRRQARDAEALMAASSGERAQLDHTLGVLSQRASANPEASELRDEIARIAEQMEALAEHQHRRRDRATLARQSVVQCERWLESLPRGTTLEARHDSEFEEPADVLAEIESVRRRIANAHRQVRMAEGAPPPREELIAMARDHTERMRERGRPLVSVAGGKLEIRHRRRQDGYSPGATPDDVAAMMAWMFPNEFLEGIVREIDAALPEDEALPASERGQTVSDLREIALNLERHEETLVRMAQNSGLDVPRRIGASPEALLGVAVVRSSRRAA